MSDDEFDEALAEYLLALESGDRAAQTAVLHAHPEYAGRLQEFLRTHAQMNELFQAETAASSAWIEASTVANFVPPTSASDSVLKAAAGRSQAAAVKPPQAGGAEAEPATPGRGQRSADSSTVWSLSRLSEQEYPIGFGDYELLGEIGRGGMGVVFKGKHRSLGRVVALKVIRSGELASEEELHRFRAEAAATAAVKHPSIVPIYEVGELRGLIYFTMAYVEGQDLTSLIRQRELTPREAARIACKIAGAIDAAHREGIVHRDLKPSNILIDSAGEPYLIDFGLAKLSSLNNELTATGQILGTPAYMPPEQASGRVENLRAVDVYAIGAVLYAILTRQPPFSGPTTFDVLLQVIDREPPKPRTINRKTPRELEAIACRAMMKDPVDRYGSARELQADLESYLRGEPIAWPKLSPTERLVSWWRREPVLVSHVCGIGSTLAIVLAFADAWWPPVKTGLLAVWLLASVLFQRLSAVDRWREPAHLSWAACDIAIYTLLIYLADPPRGLLLVGYPMMIAASGLFYRVRYVLFMTSLCMLGFMLLCASVRDPIVERFDFASIYLFGLAVIGLCLLSMIRRVRGLTDYVGQHRH
jgi:eukaryotic-like serine/threonine-protein kinase